MTVLKVSTVGPLTYEDGDGYVYGPTREMILDHEGRGGAVEYQDSVEGAWLPSSFAAMTTRPLSGPCTRYRLVPISEPKTVTIEIPTELAKGLAREGFRWASHCQDTRPISEAAVTALRAAGVRW